MTLDTGITSSRDDVCALKEVQIRQGNFHRFSLSVFEATPLKAERPAAVMLASSRYPLHGLQTAWPFLHETLVHTERVSVT